MLSTKYWLDTAERIVSTFSGAILAAWAVTNNWPIILSFSGLMALYTLLKCLTASRFGDPDTASFLHLDQKK